MNMQDEQIKDARDALRWERYLEQAGRPRTNVASREQVLDGLLQTKRDSLARYAYRQARIHQCQQNFVNLYGSAGGG